MVNGLVARGGFEIGITQFDADGFAHIAFVLQVGGNPFAQAGKNGAQLGFVGYGVQVAFKSGLAADVDRFAVGYNGAVIAPP